ncbi:MAG: hypothetical protein ACREI3_03100, partial [Nitrospirales bacterium]
RLQRRRPVVAAAEDDQRESRHNDQTYESGTSCSPVPHAFLRGVPYRLSGRIARFAVRLIRSTLYFYRHHHRL